MSEDQKNSEKVTKYVTVKNVLHYDPDSKNGIVIVHPLDWAKSSLKVAGRFESAPEIGEGFKISGEISKEPWFDDKGEQVISNKSGKPLFNYVMPSASVEPMGQPVKMAGKVEKVFHADQEYQRSIALMRPAGWRSPVKVYAQAYVKVGDYLKVSGFKGREPWLDASGKPVLDKEGNPRWNMEIRATEASVRDRFKDYEGAVTRVFTYNEETGDAIVLMNPGFKHGRDVKAYVNLPQEPIVGAAINIKGFIVEEVQQKDGKPVTDGSGKVFTNLVIQGVECFQSPAAEMTLDEPSDAVPAPPFPADGVEAEDEEDGPRP